MIYDVRTYTCRPGTVKAQLELYAAHGFEAQKRHLGEPVIYGVTEIGPLNSYVHVWAYEDISDRDRKRAGMESDPDWAAFRKKSAEADNLISQENRIISQAPFLKR